MWTLVWEDNFNENYLDSEKWKMGTHWLGIGGNLLFANSGESVIVENGHLTLRGEKRTETFAGITKEYASAEISTFQQFKQKYGYFEARIKYDAVKGAWPAFWMMPDRGVKQGGFWHADARSFVKFDINNQNAVISSAKLKLKVLPTTEITENQNVSIHKIIDNSSWSEENVTWSNQPICDAAFLKQFIGTTNPQLLNQIIVGEYIEIDVTNYINNQIDSNKQFAGFAMMDRFMKEKRVEFGSRENSDINNRPVLEIDGTLIYPSDDATVVITEPSANFGKLPNLYICEKWDSTSKTDNSGMEMDIMESLGIWGENKTQHALHWDNYGTDHKYIGSGQIEITPTTDGFHTYGMEWNEGEMKFYIDGKHTWTHTNQRVSTVESYIILSLQLGGWNGSGNTPVDDSGLPADMVIDYVKVYSNDETAAVESFDAMGRTLSIAPNPIRNGNLVFKIKDYSESGSIVVSITDALGRVLYSSFKAQNFDGEMNISLNRINLKRGIYILKVKGDNLVLAKKFIY
jgi:beta-glucanase (GH16 family)